MRSTFARNFHAERSSNARRQRELGSRPGITSALPSGSEREFEAFGDHWEAAAERDDEKKCRWDNVKAAVELHTARKLKQTRDERDKHSQDQFMLAAIQKPTPFRTRQQRVQHEGTSARKDAEEEVRSLWLQILCGIVSNTNTPMRRMVRDKPGSIQLVGAGRRGTTLRARTRAIRRYVISLASAFSVPFPSDVSHVVEYVQVKLNLGEPSNRGSIKGAHQAMCFFEEVCRVGEPDRYTNIPTALLAAIEDLVLDETAFCYSAFFGWWHLVQSWGTLRFSGHRAIVPTHVELDEQGFTAKLTHSKTLGSDRNVTMCLVVINRACISR